MTINGSYAKAVIRRDEDRRTLENMRRIHAEEVAAMEAHIAESTEIIDLAETASVEIADAFAVARRCIDVTWSYEECRDDGTWVGRKWRSAEVHQAFDRAIEQIRLGGGTLFSQYVGVKRYDRFHSQTCDCSYGMGPSHGVIWFSIGLTANKRAMTAAFPLSEDERIMCVKYLQWLREQAET